MTVRQPSLTWGGAPTTRSFVYIVSCSMTGQFSVRATYSVLTNSYNWFWIVPLRTSNRLFCNGHKSQQRRVMNTNALSKMASMEVSGTLERTRLRMGRWKQSNLIFLLWLTEILVQIKYDPDTASLPLGILCSVCNALSTFCFVFLFFVSTAVASNYFS